MQSDNYHSRSFELDDLSKMDRIRKLFKAQPTYAPINTEAQEDNAGSYVESNESLPLEETTFSWIEYSIFMLLGVAMLWAWCDPPLLGR
jgi:equilibrative nucleoside transporter 1/2/3